MCIWPSVVPLFCGGFYAKMMMMLMLLLLFATAVLLLCLFQLVVFGFLHCSTNVNIATILISYGVDAIYLSCRSAAHRPSSSSSWLSSLLFVVDETEVSLTLRLAVVPFFTLVPNESQDSSTLPDKHFMNNLSEH